MTLLTRRGVITGIGATLVASPAIVRACNIMPVRNHDMLNIRRLMETIQEAITEATQHHLFETPSVWWAPSGFDVTSFRSVLLLPNWPSS